MHLNHDDDVGLFKISYTNWRGRSVQSHAYVAGLAFAESHARHLSKRTLRGIASVVEGDNIIVTYKRGNKVST